MNASSRPPLTPFFTAGTRTPALVTLPGRDAPRGARLVRLRVRDHDDLARVVTEEIARVPGINRTQTLVAFKVYSRHDVEALFSVGFEE